jgi:hypothetical protein
MKTTYNSAFKVYTVNNPSVEMRRCATANLGRVGTGRTFQLLMTEEIAASFGIY